MASELPSGSCCSRSTTDLGAAGVGFRALGAGLHGGEHLRQSGDRRPIDAALHQALFDEAGERLGDLA